MTEDSSNLLRIGGSVTLVPSGLRAKCVGVYDNAAEVELSSGRRITVLFTHLAWGEAGPA